VNSRWSSAVRAAALVALTVGAPACSSEKSRQRAVQAEQRTPQGSAQLLGRELAEIVDRVMSYRSSHRGQLPASLRQAGLDSLTPIFIRQYSRQGSDPLVTIRFRNTEGRPVVACRGTNMVLEDAMLHEGRFDVSCETSAGGVETFTIEPPPPPKKDEE